MPALVEPVARLIEASARLPGTGHLSMVPITEPISSVSPGCPGTQSA